MTGIPREEFIESVEETERPRLHTRSYLELIYDIPHRFRKEGLQTMEVYFYLTKNIILTIENERNTLFDRIQRNKSKFMFRSKGRFLYHMLDEINDEYLRIIDTINRALNIKDLSKVSIQGLYEKNTTTTYFNTAIIANLEVLNQLKKSRYRAFMDIDRRNFTELYLDKLQILDTQKIQRQVVMNMINIQSIISTEKLNQTMKKLAAMALIIMIPTVISGIFGMNVDIPFDNHPFAFFFIILLTVFISTTLFLLMKKRDWL